MTCLMRKLYSKRRRYVNVSKTCSAAHTRIGGDMPTIQCLPPVSFLNAKISRSISHHHHYSVSCMLFPFPLFFSISSNRPNRSYRQIMSSSATSSTQSPPYDSCEALNAKDSSGGGFSFSLFSCSVCFGGSACFGACMLLCDVSVVSAGGC